MDHSTCDHANAICFDTVSAGQFASLSSQAESNLAGLDSLFAELGVPPVFRA